MTVCFVGNGENIFAGTSSGVYRAMSSDTAWFAAGLTGRFIRALATDGPSLFAGTPEGVFRSTNNGSSWTSAGLTGSAIFSLLVKDTSLLAGTTSGVFRSPVGDTTWIPIGPLDALVYVILVDDNRLFTGTSRGVYRTTDSGNSWTAVNSGLTDTIVTSLAFDTGSLYAGAYFGSIARTTDQGTSWDSIGSIGATVFSIIARGSNVLAGSLWAGGLFLSTNSGITWTRVNNGLPTMDVRALALIGTSLYAGTFAHGVWKRPLSELVGIQLAQDDLPYDFALHQNYPNPFNATTTINYQIATKSHAKLTVFDVLGGEVASLVNDTQEPWYKSIQWDASNVTSGMYFCQLRAGAFIETRKMLLTK